MKLFRIGIVFIIAIIILGCPVTGSNTSGNVHITFNVQENRSTIIPEIVSAVVEYRITVSGGPQTVEPMITGSTSVDLGLPSGTWNILVEALNNEGQPVASGSVNDISVSSGSSVSEEVILDPATDGTGSVRVTVTWPESITVSSADITVEFDSADVPMDSDTIIYTAHSLLYYNLSVSSGENHQIRIILIDSEMNQDTILEGVHVYDNLESSAVYNRNVDDFKPVLSVPIIADHTVVDKYSDIPQVWIDEVKKILLMVGGESHGRAYNYGLQLLENLDPKFTVATQWSGTPESYTTEYLRSTRSYRFGNSWSNSMGEEDCYTNSAAVSNMKTGLSYTASNYSGIIVQGFGWCWDMTWHNSPTSEKDPEYGCGWAGSSVGADNDLPWGLDAGDTSITGNSISLQNYLDAVAGYNEYEPDILFIYTTGPVDGNHGTEAGYQRFLKHKRIREWVNETKGILFDYADILCWNDNGIQTMDSWDGHTFQNGDTTLATGGDGYDGGDGGCHISEEGCLRIGKALWWMLARIAGWDGN